MLVKTNSFTIYGLDLIPVTIEVNVSSRGFPGFDIIGLPGKEISESKERIATALRNIDVSISGKKILVNLAPADIPKEGSFYDFPIAVSIACILQNISLKSNVVMFGELSLDGTIKPSNKNFLAYIFALQNGINSVLVSSKNMSGFPLHAKLELLRFNDISEVLTFFKAGIYKKDVTTEEPNTTEVGMHSSKIEDIVGQENAKRALEISAAGSHNLFFEGPPGAGKTMLSNAYIDLLPALGDSDALNVTKIHTVAGSTNTKNILISVPPFRCPHHTISYAGMIGGGAVPRPGEVSLAHKGVLFLDEFPEFNRQVIESLRQPLEDARAIIIRSSGVFTFPAEFTLLAASNPCPCGYFMHNTKPCKCTPQQIQRYRTKMSGPILDRIDMNVFVHDVDIDKLSKSSLLTKKSSIETMKSRVTLARRIQKERLVMHKIEVNSQMNKKLIEKYCKITSDSRQLLILASQRLNISARSYYKILKVARTIADLDNEIEIKSNHIAEALQYRR